MILYAMIHPDSIPLYRAERSINPSINSPMIVPMTDSSNDPEPVSSQDVPSLSLNLLDVQRLDAISRRNRRFQRRLLQKVLAIADKDRDQLLTELKNQNWPAIEIAVHRLKGSTANVGAIAVHQVTTELEAAVEARNPEQCEDALTLLKQKLVELDDFIRQHYPPLD